MIGVVSAFIWGDEGGIGAGLIVGVLLHSENNKMQMNKDKEGVQFFHQHDSMI